MESSEPTSTSTRDYWVRDPIYRMRAFQLSCDLYDESWADAETLSKHPVTVKTAGQLYAAVGSIKANIADGYSRSSGRDRVRLYEYALSSARESMVWYGGGENVLGMDTVHSRLQVLEEIRRLLLTTVPRERDRLIRRIPSESDAVKPNNEARTFFRSPQSFRSSQSAVFPQFAVRSFSAVRIPQCQLPYSTQLSTQVF